MNKKILNYILIFVTVYLILGIFFNPDNENTEKAVGDFSFNTTKKEYTLHELVSVTLKNNTQSPVSVPNDCPAEPLIVQKKVGGQWQQQEATSDLTCADPEEITIEPGEELAISYDHWNNQIFDELATYKIKAEITFPDTEQDSITIETDEFTIKPQGFFGYIWTAGFYQPIYNTLIYLTSIVPNHDFGIAIILLTIIIRTILLVPAHNAMKSQRRMQEVQPKLKKIQEKYKGNQEMIAKETMQLWKEHKVNPFGSCLPLLIQLPFLIAIFYVIQNGLTPNDTYLLYEPLKDFSLASINTNFLGILELTNLNFFVLPLIVGGLQFVQMKLALMRTQNQKKDDNQEKKPKSEMEMASLMMLYFMPVMIALFTASLPAGVGLYWSTSTLYGIAQQFFVNKQMENSDVKVKVLKNK
jgi:YidC/Oxa1 family membrane protein insertase